MAPSRTKVDKAGRLRDWWRAPSDSDEEDQFDDDELTDAIGIIVDYRSGFQDPLKKVTVGLRQFVERESSEVTVGQRLKVLGIEDYVASPKDTGYRDVHVVVRRDGHSVEIQLRTPGQHEWAEAVERWAARTRFPLKDGEGPSDLLSYLDLVAWGISADEQEEEPDAAFMEVLSRFKARIDHYLTVDR